jgi:Protein of unknown function (DUF1553)
VTCEKRNITTVPTQALTMLNNEFVLIQARNLAERVLRDASGDPAKQVRLLYRIALSREPVLSEFGRNLRFILNQHDYHAAQIYQSLKKESERNRRFFLRDRDYYRTRLSEADLMALTDLAHVMLNTNEFIYIN